MYRCAYSDLILALRRVRSASGGAVQKCLFVDLDVHQARQNWWLRLQLPLACMLCAGTSIQPTLCWAQGRGGQQPELHRLVISCTLSALAMRHLGLWLWKRKACACLRSPDLPPAQGNGHERDKLHFQDKDLYILDIYGKVRY